MNSYYPTLSTAMLRITQLCYYVVPQLRTLYQQPFSTYLHHHRPVSAAVSKLNFLHGEWR